jgi:DNA-binding CsgD family transcriptional regulator
MLTGRLRPFLSPAEESGILPRPAPEEQGRADRLHDARAPKAVDAGQHVSAPGQGGHRVRSEEITLLPGEPEWLADELADDAEPIAGRTQLEKILSALEEGAQTSSDVADRTGLTVKTVAAYLYALRQQGTVRLVAPFARRYSRSGSGSHVYALAEGSR